MTGRLAIIEWARRAAAVAAAVCATALGLLVWGALPAGAVFGDEFGVAPHVEDAPALVDLDGDPLGRVFWAGACDRAAAPGFGEPIGGGIGARPSSVAVPTEGGVYSFDSVPAPAVAAHCVDWGREAEYPCSEGTSPCPDSRLWATAGGGLADGRPGWRLPAEARAGAHPDATAVFHLARHTDPDSTSQFSGYVDGAVDNIVAQLPAGFVGDPTAVPKCSAAQFAVKPLQCPPSSQVGVLQLVLEPAISGNLGRADSVMHPVYNLQPRQGNLAELGVAYLSTEQATTARIVAKARTRGDFGVTTFVSQVPAVLPMISQQITLWGVPWAAANDIWRPAAGDAGARIPREGLAAADRVSYDPSWGPIRPFLSNPTECAGGRLNTRLLLDSYEQPGVFDSDGHPATPPFPGLPDPASGWEFADVLVPPVGGCEQPPFDPSLDLGGASRVADGPSGLDATLSLPANDDPPAAVAADAGEGSQPDGSPGDLTAGAPGHWRSEQGRATAQLKSTVVTLPEGWSVNPAGAAGLRGCSDAQFGLVADGSPPVFDNDDPFDGRGKECPAGSKIGKVAVTTPVLDDPLDGDLVLGTPRSTDPASGEMFRLFIVARSQARGLVAKVAGHATANPSTGQLTTTFAQNPRVPFEQIRLQVKGGQRGMLATPPSCRTSGWAATLVPWTAPAGPTVNDTGPLAVDQRCGRPFAPGLSGGTAPRLGGGHGTLSLEIARPDGHRWLKTASVTLPEGLLANVGDVPLCTDAQAAANACPPGSRIGTVDAAAGAGAPYFLERKGSIYLTEGYKSAPYGTLVSVPVEAGPFRGRFALETITVRQALHIDPTTGQATAVSDPIPTIWHGIPLRARIANVVVDRPGFVVNPTDCDPATIDATLGSVDGATAAAQTPFQASRCDRLGFNPKLRLRLTGRRQTTTGRHPGVRALVTQKPGRAAIDRARVVLPKSLALDPANAQGLCEHSDGTRPDPENHCPRRSIVGRARAVSPLLSKPLSGPVFFVKNIRIDPRTGNEIRTLPMIVVALRGEIAINLQGQSSTTKNGRLVNTFAQVPDAPVRRFAMRIKGGRAGILAVTRTRRSRIDICKRRQTALTRMHAQNDRRHTTRTHIKTPCPKNRRARARRCNTKPKRHAKACRRQAKRRQATRHRHNRRR